MTRKNPKQGSPQQRRFAFGFEGSLLNPEVSTIGQEDWGRGVFSRVANPGDGKAASIPERPDRCLPSGATIIVRKNGGRSSGYLLPISLSLARSVPLK